MKAKAEIHYKLEIVKEIQPHFDYDTCKRQLIWDDLKSGNDARTLAKHCMDSLQGTEFFLMSEYKNGKRVWSGKICDL